MHAPTHGPAIRFGPPWALLSRAFAASLALHGFGAALYEALPPAPNASAFSLVAARAAPLRATLRVIPGNAPKKADEPAARDPGQQRVALEEPRHKREESSSLPGPRYFTAAELDVRPAPRVQVMPDYAGDAAREGLKGKVLVRLYLDESGDVERLAIVRADPPGAFDDAVTKAFGTAHFTPGMKDGQAVRSQLLIEVNFN